jgi:hypothetical protein
MKRKIGIVGGCISEEDLFPYSEEYELWSMNNLFNKFPKIPWSLWFELHDIKKRGSIYYRRGYKHYPIGNSQTVNEYLSNINLLDCPVFMQKKRKIIKNSLAFPFKELIKKYGSYWGCSFAWMTAFAIEEKVDEIAYFGVALNGAEYYYQRPSTEYYIGIAQGLGIKTLIHNSSRLLQGRYVYAYDENPNKVLLLHTHFSQSLCIKILTAIQDQMDLFDFDGVEELYKED